MTTDNQSVPAWVELVEVCHECLSLLEFATKREVESPSNHQEFAREAQDRLHRFRAALKRADELLAAAKAHPWDEDTLRRKISTEGMEREPCGHFKTNLIGDEHGHFECDACKITAKAAGAPTVPYRDCLEYIEDFRKMDAKTFGETHGRDLLAAFQALVGAPTDKESFTRGRNWEIAEWKRHLVEHRPAVAGVCSWCKGEEEFRLSSAPTQAQARLDEVVHIPLLFDCEDGGHDLRCSCGWIPVGYTLVEGAFVAIGWSEHITNLETAAQSQPSAPNFGYPGQLRIAPAEPPDRSAMVEWTIKRLQEFDDAPGETDYRRTAEEIVSKIAAMGD